MLWIYFDASALIKRFTVETGTDQINEVFRHIPTSQMACSKLGILEIVSVLIRKKNDRRLPQSLFEQAMIEFRAAVIDDPDFAIVPVHDALLSSALQLITAHNLNATDAIILRSAIELHEALVPEGHSLILCAADKRLVRAARAEGLVAYDPEQETVQDFRRLLTNQ